MICILLSSNEVQNSVLVIPPTMSDEIEKYKLGSVPRESLLEVVSEKGCASSLLTNNGIQLY